MNYQIQLFLTILVFAFGYWILLQIAHRWNKWISNCFEVRNKSIARGDPKQLRPMCDEYGYYLNPRCEVHKNVRFCTCWLAEGYIVKGPSDLIKSCTCFLDHFVAKRTYERTGRPRYIPQCAASGFYLQKQCDETIKKCWCVDQEGVMLKGTLNDDSVKQKCKSLFKLDNH